MIVAAAVAAVAWHIVIRFNGSCLALHLPVEQAPLCERRHHVNAPVFEDHYLLLSVHEFSELAQANLDYH